MSSVDVTFTSTTTFFSLAFEVSPEPHEVGLQPRSCNSPFVLPLVGQRVFCSDGDLITGRPHRLAVLPPLLVGDQSSLFEGVVEEDVDDSVMAGIDLTADSGSNLRCASSSARASLAAPALRVHLLLRYKFLSSSPTGGSPESL